MGITNGIITQGVTLRQLALFFGVGRRTADGHYHLSDICTAAKINENSRRKPIDVGYNRVLTEADFKAADYGFSIGSFSSARAAGDAYWARTAWRYVRPTSWKRISDFWGYNHYAASLFPLDYDGTPAVGGTAQFSCDLSDLLEWGTFAGFGPAYTSLYVGLGLFNGSGVLQAFYPLTTGSSGRTTLDIAGDAKMNYAVPSAYFTAGATYYIAPLLTTYDFGDSYGAWMSVSGLTGTWWAVPTERAKVVPSAQVLPSDRVDVYVDTDAIAYSGSSPMTITSVPISITNGNGTAITGCVLTVTFDSYQTATKQTVSFASSGSFSVNASGSKALTLEGSATVYPLGERANGNYTLVFSHNGTTYTLTGGFGVGEK